MNMRILTILLLSCWISGFIAEDPVVTHYQLPNSSVCLHVRKTPPYENVKWQFKDQVLAIGKGLNKKYNKTMVFNPENLTLCINNLTERDSGIYEASFISNFNNNLVRHQLIVQEMVPRPVMVVMPESRSNLSSASCRATVNCSIQGDDLLSVCDQDDCRPSQKSFSKFNITVVSDNTTIVCSGNNHVSTNNISESYATWCYVKSKPEPEEESKPRLKIELIIMFCVGFIITCAAFTFKHFSKQRQQQTSATPLIQSGPLDTQPRTEPRASTSSSSEAEPSYENVDINQARGSSSIPREEHGTRDTQGVDTVYSIPIATASRVKYESSKNKAGHANSETASASETSAEAQEPGCEQTETVYTLLQIPKSSQPQPENV